MHVARNGKKGLRRRITSVVLGVLALVGISVATSAPAQAWDRDGGERCVVQSYYGTLCADMRQYYANANFQLWGEFYPKSTAADRPNVDMSVEMCGLGSVVGECRKLNKIQFWDITTDYNNECTYIYRGGPTDSGRCDMPGLNYDTTSGYTYFARVRLFVNGVQVSYVDSPYQLSRG